MNEVTLQVTLDKTNAARPFEAITRVLQVTPSQSNQASSLLEIIRIRNEIASRNYDNPERMNTAIDRLLEELWP